MRIDALSVSIDVADAHLEHLAHHRRARCESDAIAMANDTLARAASRVPRIECARGPDLDACASANRIDACRADVGA